jgi:hypothetical protein
VTKPAARKRELLEHREQAARLLRGFINATLVNGCRLVPEWQEWFDRDEALESLQPRKKARGR